MQIPQVKARDGLLRSDLSVTYLLIAQNPKRVLNFMLT